MSTVGSINSSEIRISVQEPLVQVPNENRSCRARVMQVALAAIFLGAGTAALYIPIAPYFSGAIAGGLYFAGQEAAAYAISLPADPVSVRWGRLILGALCYAAGTSGFHYVSQTKVSDGVFTAGLFGWTASMMLSFYVANARRNISCCDCGM